MRSFANEHVGLVLERSGVVGIGPVKLREEQWNVLEPRVGVRPAHEAVERSGLAIVVAGVDLLEILTALGLAAGEGDLDHLPHLRGPPSQRLDELAQGQAASGLRLKSVFMDVLHGDRILAAVRRALSQAAPVEAPRMRRLTRVAAFVAAGLITLSSTASSGPILAAGPPLRYLAGPPGTLDPAFIADAADVQLLLQLYAGLTRLDETGEPYPSLASGWEISADGLTYEFTIRPDLEFSDGAALVAGDIRRSWLRLLDPATEATAPDVLSVVQGASERLAGDASEDEVGIEAPDDATLVVTLKHPASYFLDIVATPAAFVVPAHADATATWQTPEDFVGSGPYVVDGLAEADLVLRANERYVAGTPPIDEIRWVGDVEADSVTAFADDQVDLAGVAGWDATWIAYDAELGPRLHAAEPLTISYFGFDTTQPPFDDARVRLAFGLALDRERLVPLSEGAGAQPAASLVPPAIWPDGFAPELDADPERARQLLDEAGYSDRGRLGTIVVNGNGLLVDPAVAVWREELGVEIEVETMEFGTFLELLDTRRSAQIFTVNWIADYASPHALYGLLLEPGALSNYGDWRDDEFARLLDVAAAASEDELGSAYDAVERYVSAQAPVIPWSYGETWWLVADGLRGLGNLTIGLLDFGRVSWDR